nr:50S ribosomal protein L22P [uncultured archaeon]
MAKAKGISLPISHKQAREICHYLKSRRVEDAKRLLERVLNMTQAVPFKRFNMDVGHKPGIAAGRYPQNASKEILKLIESAEKNANNKGLNDLFITHMNAHIAAPGQRGGRTAGQAKRAHVEIVVEQKNEEKKTNRERKK